MKKFSEEQKKDLKKIKTELYSLFPEKDKKNFIKHLNNEDLLHYLEKHVIPVLFGSFENTRASIVNLLILVANLLQRDKYLAYIQAMDDIPAFIDSYQPSFIPDCPCHRIKEMKGKVEVKACFYNGGKPGSCNKAACPMPNDERPEPLQKIDCPVCEGDLKKTCSICFNLGTVEKGKICPTCEGNPIECETCGNSRINPEWQE